MDQTSPVILSVEAPALYKIIIETSDGKRYRSDLSEFKSVHCFPTSESEWKKVSIDSYGLGLVWSSRFEVHLDQVIDCATTEEQTAAKPVAG